MHDETIEAARTKIKIAAILRLLIIALSALGLAYAYSDEQENLYRIYRDAGRVPALVAFFLFDTVLTILWLYHPKIHTIHLILYAVFGCFFYVVYVLDVLNLYGVDAVIALILAPCIWLIGLIPFILCGSGRKN